MIPSDQTLPLRVTTHACANGETVEMRLMMGDLQVGEPIWVNQFKTPLPVAVSKLLARALDDTQGTP